MCTESNECNVKMVNGKTITVSGVPGKAAGTGTDTPSTTATDLPALEGTGTDTGDPIADLIAWITELFEGLFNR